MAEDSVNYYYMAIPRDNPTDVYAMLKTYQGKAYLFHILERFSF
jgi:hypothetical protein